ncbi:DUF6881 domain-containing protein, partial [Ralstonia pseudosolanacearum]
SSRLTTARIGNAAYTMTEHRPEYAGTKLLPLEQPYAIASHDEWTARASVVAGLTSGMDYWAGLAVGWIESGLPVDTQLAELLFGIAKLRHMPQRLRHRAFALAKRWQKSLRPEFIDVRWSHCSDAGPTRLVSELDEQRMETRKLEFFEDGRVGYAWADHTAHGTELGLAPVPPLVEINADPEFVGTTITAAEFDALWLEHVPMPRYANTADAATWIWERTRSREHGFDSIVEPARKDVEASVRSASNGTKVWSGHFGATGIDPKHLFIYFVLPTRADVDALTASPSWPAIVGELRHKLELAGYPVSSLGENWIGLFSQQACDEEVGGNWYHFFK